MRKIYFSISVLCFLTFFSGCGPSDEWMHGSTKKLLANLRTAHMTYTADFGKQDLNGNQNLVRVLRSLGPKRMPYYEFSDEQLNSQGKVVDSWGNPLIYRNDELYSAGPNETDDGGKGDDIR